MEKTLIIIRELLNEGLLASNFGNSYILWEKASVVSLIAGLIALLITVLIYFIFFDDDEVEKSVNIIFCIFGGIAIAGILFGVFASIKTMVMDAEIERAMLLSNVDFGALIKSLL